MAAGVVVATAASWGLAASAAAAEDPTCSAQWLRNQVTAANGAGGPVTITLAAGCEYVFDKAIRGKGNGRNATNLITGELRINGNGATLRRAADAPRFRLLEVARGARLSLFDLTITGGHTADGVGPGGPGLAGGGVYSAGSLTLVDVTVRGNTTGNGADQDGAADGGAGGPGGGVASTGNVFVTGGAVTGNTTGRGGVAGPDGPFQYVTGAGGKGGGIYQLSGATEVRESTVSDNTAGAGGSSGGAGGGIAADAGTVTLVYARLTGNAAGDGAPGAPGADGADSPTGVGTQGAPGGHGGAGGNGGGLFATQADVAATSVVVANNRAGNGAPGGRSGNGGDGVEGGLGNHGGAGGQGGSGGGLYVMRNLTLTEGTVSGNRAGDGAAGGASGDGGIGSQAGGFGGSGDFIQGAGGRGGDGGGICVCGDTLVNPVSVSVSVSAIDGNSAGNGGRGGDGGNGGAGPRPGYGGSAAWAGSGGSGGGLVVSTTQPVILNADITDNRGGAGGDGGDGGDAPTADARAGTGGPAGAGGTAGVLLPYDGTTVTFDSGTIRGNIGGDGGAGGIGGFGSVYLDDGGGGAGGAAGGGGAAFPSSRMLLLDRTIVSANTAGAAGPGGLPTNPDGQPGAPGAVGHGGVAGNYDTPADGLQLRDGAQVIDNVPDNCYPADRFAGCTG